MIVETFESVSSIEWETVEDELYVLEYLRDTTVNFRLISLSKRATHSGIKIGDRELHVYEIKFSHEIQLGRSPYGWEDGKHLKPEP